jgi:hypothetical protein
MKITIIIIIAALIIAGIAIFMKYRSGKGFKYKSKFSDEEYERDYELKKVALERILGPMHNTVGHAIIPFHVGGAVDMYYFPKTIPGTAFVTMELIEPDGSGPKPNRIGTYELIAFTKLKISGNLAPKDPKQMTPFNKIERNMCGILTRVGFYSYDAVLNPGDTSEIPWEKSETNCLIFDEYKKDGVDFEINGKRHCLLLCIEVFKSEMEYAMKNSSAPVLKKLKEKGYYPYSDLDREPVY